MKKILKVTLNFTLIGIMLFCTYKVYEKISDYKQADQVYASLRESVNTTIINLTETKTSRYDDLVKINSDYRFWIKVKNTNIDYPVTQGKDNSFYLTHDFNKKYLASGSIFMDFRNDFENDKNVVIYGHHMRNKTMFGELTELKKEKLFRENNIIEVEYKDKIYTYEIFSVYVEDAKKDFLKVKFESDSEYEDCLNNIKNKSLFKTNVDLDKDDKIVTLYTCSYEFNGARTIVHGKLISVK